MSRSKYGLFVIVGLSYVFLFVNCPGSPSGEQASKDGSVEQLADTKPHEPFISDEAIQDQTPSAIRIKQGPYTMEVRQAPWVLRLLNNGQEMTRIALDGFQLGWVRDYDAGYNYDPFWLAPTRNQKAIPIPGLKWFKPRSAKVLEATTTKLRFSFAYDQNITATLDISIERDGTFALQWHPTKTKQVVLMRLQCKVDDRENYYGLGEYFDQVAHRGKLRAMQIEIDFKLESSYNEAHFPVPFFTGTKGWGLFIKSYWPGVFDMGRKDPRMIEVTYHTNQMDFYLLAADHPLKVPGLYTRITGAPAVPAPWAFGTMLWRDENKDQAEVLEDAKQIRKNDLAISAMWIDRPYDVAVNNFGFDKKRYPDHKAMIATLHKQGFRLGLWSTPYAEKKTDIHPFIKDKGWFVQLGLRALNKWSNPIDFTHPEALAYWKKQVKKYTDLGIEGFKLDYGEDIQVGLGGVGRPISKFHNGEDERTMHHKYMLYYHQAYAANLPKKGGYLICRGGTWGSQKYVSIVWPGDLDTGFQTHYQCTDNAQLNGRCWVGGLPASIIGGLTLSQSGFPFYGSDTGGYRRSRTKKRAFIRWGQQTALSMIMQIGGPDPNVNPWDFTKYKDSQFDRQVLDNFRKYIRLHTRLFPYFYTYAQAAQHHQVGPVRPYGIAFPKEGYHPNDQYLLGPYLMVAPVVTSKDEREIQMPQEHNWIDFWSQELYKGGKKVSYKAPLDVLPLFLRSGSILPLLRPDIDTLSPSKVAGVVSYANDPGRLYLAIVPGEDTQLKLFDETEIRLKQETRLTIKTKAGKTFTQGYMLSVWRYDSIQKVQANQRELPSVNSTNAVNGCNKGCWFWNSSMKKLWINLPQGTKYSIDIQGVQRKDSK